MHALQFGVLAFTCGAALTAQSGSRFHALGSDGAFALAAVGNFTGTQRMSVAFTCDSEVVVALDPSLHSWFRTITAQQVTGLATLPSGDLLVADRIMAVDSNGAYLLELAQDLGSLSRVATLDGDWQGARQLVAERRPGTRCVVCAVDGAGTSILVGTESLTGYITTAAISIGATILDLALTDWDHDGASEVCALTAAGVLPFRLGGTPLPALLLPGQEQLGIERLVDPSGERLAWLSRAVGSATCQLAVVDAAAAELPVALAPGLFGLPPATPFTVCGLAAARVGADGYGDLLISQLSNDTVACVLRSAPTAGSNPAVSIMPVDLDDTVAIKLANCAPLFADFDRDGDTDVVAMCDVPAGMRVCSGVPISVVGVAAPALESEHIYAVGPNGHSLDLRLTPAYLTGASTLLVSTFLMPSRSSPTMTYVSTQTFSVVAGLPATFPVVLPPQIQVSNPATSPPSPTWPTSPAVRIEFRTMSASGQIGPTQSNLLVVRNSLAETVASLRDYFGSDPKRIVVRPTLVGGIAPRTLTPPPVD